LDALHFDTLRNRSAAHQAEVRAPDDADIRALCQDTALDTVMLRGERDTALRHFSWPGRPTISIFECRLLRHPATEQ
jgi:hypothetical protein